jgi:hypothetical protein
MSAMDARGAAASYRRRSMFFKRKTTKDGERAEAVVLGADMSGYSNSHGINKWHLHLRVKVEVDRDAMVAAKQAGRKEAEEGLIRLGEERIERGEGK